MQKGAKKKKYLWIKQLDKELMIMPRKCVEHFLVNPTMPESMISRMRKRANVSAPQPLDTDFLFANDIISASISKHRKGFYLSRNKPDYHLVIYTRKGRSLLRIGKEKKIIRRGDVFIAPAGSVFEYTAQTDWDVFWFHISARRLWKAYSGKAPLLKKAESFSYLDKIMDIYFEEIYKPSEKRSAPLLRALSETITECLRREFMPFKSKTTLNSELEGLVLEYSSNPQKRISIKKAAKKLGISESKFNRLCDDIYGQPFGSILLKNRMLTAKTLLSDESNLTNAQIAEKLGYSDQYSFSKAYKLFYGHSPKCRTQTKKTA